MDDLYQEIILDHNKSPKNFRELDYYTHSHECNNYFCGDVLTIYINIENNWIKELTFNGQGCALFKASASMMTQYCTDVSFDEFIWLFRNVQNLVTGKELEDPIPTELMSFEHVGNYPVRVKCVTMPWHCVNEIIKEIAPKN